MARTEHYVTLFDSAFLPYGLCLHESLLREDPAAWLWIVCMDEPVHAQLTRLSLPRVSLVRLAEAETPALRAVKPDRTAGEYCWTLTPFVPSFVFERAPQAERVTYVDADLYFFASPASLLGDFEASGKQVLLTEHAYDPEYDYSAQSGRFCVQFMTFRRSAAAFEVLADWQGQCIEWCYDRVEPGRFGDQKYLDEWPQRFADSVHVLGARERTVGPWNARFFHRRDGALAATFYHFHGFRLVGSHLALTFSHFEVGQGARAYYRGYLIAMRRSLRRLRGMDIPVRTRPLPPALRPLRTLAREWWQGRAAFARV
ncbi:hypothetical protein [Ramlibacter sp.]|uniref:hypothetical protein n=1 Tax=Ramlibacter sp. TaxID=1917967 RepID=UPI00183D952A|nr:hypothetical protein [Ramlibacter sp.]MBA2673309.1 glycosyl transferase [Ramlibacter sp.]